MSDGLWTAAEAATATGGTATGAWSANGVSIDSRDIAAGDLFIAIRGPRFDGHDFAAAALGSGAVAVMIDRRPDGLAADAPALVVGDTMDGLVALGAASRARTAARIVAVTGSVGKTGTKEALRAVLSRQGATAASDRSFNNHWGVPLSLARMPRDSVFGVFEVGMNHPGEITPLSKLIRPEVAIITTIAPAHIEFFDSLEAVADAKAEIFAGMDGGTAILNRDNGMYDRLAHAATDAGVGRIVSFGAHRDADARLISAAGDRLGTNVDAVISGGRIAYRLTLPGQHHVMNSLAVLACVDALGADVADAARALSDLRPLAGRGAQHEVRIDGGTVFVIDESYNANPASMQAAIETLGRFSGGRRIAALGEMRELGAASQELHAALADCLGENGVDLVFACGPLMEALFAALPDDMKGAIAADAHALAALIVDAVRPGDIVTVKGSLSSGMKAVVDALVGLGGTAPRAANG